jgi:hypothetical protein
MFRILQDMSHIRSPTISLPSAPDVNDSAKVTPKFYVALVVGGVEYVCLPSYQFDS